MEAKKDDEISIDLPPSKGGISDFIDESVSTEWTVREEKILKDIQVKCQGYHYLFIRSRKLYKKNYWTIMIPFGFFYGLSNLLQSLLSVFLGMAECSSFAFPISIIATLLSWSTISLLGISTFFGLEKKEHSCKQFARAFADLSNDIETALKLPRDIRIPPNRMIIEVTNQYNRLRKEDEIVREEAIIDYKNKFKNIKQKVELVSENISDNQREYQLGLLSPFVKGIKEIQLTNKRDMEYYDEDYNAG